MNNTTNHFQYLINNKNWTTIKHTLSKLNHTTLAEVIVNISLDKDRIVLFRLLSAEKAQQIFYYMSFEERKSIKDGFVNNSFHLIQVLDELALSKDSTLSIEELPGEVSQQIMQELPIDNQDIKIKILGYPPGSIGHFMTHQYIAVRSTYLIDQVMKHIRVFGSDSEMLNTIYVVDEYWTLLGSTSLNDIVLASPCQSITEFIDKDVAFLSASENKSDAIDLFIATDTNVLPIVDSNKILVGIVLADQVLDLSNQNQLASSHNISDKDAELLNPLKARIFELFTQRIFWLFALVFINIFSGTIISHYEKVIQLVVPLVFYLTLPIGSSGNAGSQSATLMIRALAVGDVKTKDWIRLFGKEFFVSLLLGITMALGVSLLSFFQAPSVTPVLAISMVITVVTGSLLGMLLPFLLTKLRIDPATASVPLITSACDIIGILIYLSFASWYFGI